MAKQISLDNDKCYYHKLIKTIVFVNFSYY